MDVPYQIIKSNRKTITIQIIPSGEVVVRCPKRMHIEEARRFVESNRYLQSRKDVFRYRLLAAARSCS